MYRFLFIALLTIVLHGSSYNKTLINLHSKVFHKIILLDKDLKEKLVDGKVCIYILYEESDYYESALCQKVISHFIKKKYPYETKIVITEFKNIATIKDATALFLLNSTEEKIQKATKLAKKLNIISYAYNPEYLKYGVLISLDIGKTIKPYVNFKSIKLQKIRFNPIIARISKGYNQ